MANKSPRNPYQDIIQKAKNFLFKVFHPHKRRMWIYPANKLETGWTLETLDQRVQAADQLGYDCVLKHTNEGLEVWYVKRPPEPEYPFNL